MSFSVVVRRTLKKWECALLGRVLDVRSPCGYLLTGHGAQDHGSIVAGQESESIVSILIRRGQVNLFARAWLGGIAGTEGRRLRCVMVLACPKSV